jgi:ATP-binding cassette subfamily B protein
MARLVSLFARVNRAATALLAAIGVVQGLLLPCFTVATGALAGALRGGYSPAGPVVAIGTLFVVQRLMDPLSAEVGAALMRDVDEWLVQRVMVAVGSPPGLAHVEDPAVLDAALQAQGALTGFTPGSAAVQLPFLLKRAVWGLASLALVGSYRWWLVPVLGVAYGGTFLFAKRHHEVVTLVMHGNTDLLRRAYYLRTLALTHTVAKETRVFGLAPWLVDRYRTSWFGVMHDVWSRRTEYWPQMVVLAAGLVVIEGGALAMLARDATSGGMSVAAAVTVSQALLAAAVAVQFDWAYIAPAEAIIALDKLVELERLADQATHAIHGDLDASELPKRSIRFEGVRFAYPGREEPVFDGFDLDIQVGTSLAIVGANGAGKTTFVKLLARLYDPEGGRILVDGVDLRTIDPASWRRRLAPVFQDFLQLEVSAYDNVAFGSLGHHEAAADVEAAGRMAGAEIVIDRLPDGWDTVLSREFTGGTQLSGGEWQRLALARALFAVRSGAGVLVLDEPTAAMDVRGEADVYDRFLELTRGVTTIVISHRFSTVRRADRIVVVEAGRVIEDGTHAELMVAGGVYASMYSMQAARFAEGVDA